MDYSSLLSGGGGGGGQTAQSKAEANVDYGYTDRRKNDAWLIVAIIAGAVVLVAVLVKGK